MGDKNRNFVKCDFCSSSAVVNFQKVWKKFIIDKNGNYKEDKKFDGIEFEQPIEHYNIHLCKKHLRKWIKGEI